MKTPKKKHALPPRNLICPLTATLLLSGFWYSSVFAAEPLRLVLPPSDHAKRPDLQFFPDVLELAMRRTEARDGPFAITTSSQAMSAERATEEIKTNGLVNVMWTATSLRRESTMLPVRISLLRDLNNCRVLVIRKGEQARFAAVKSVEDLRQLRAGMGIQTGGN